jgi:DNA polymerase-1
VPTTLIADCETDGFLSEMTRIWTIQIGTPESEEVIVYADQPGFPPLAAAIARLSAAERIVFHNGVSFDIDAINKVYPAPITFAQLYDTMIVARMLNPTERKNKLEDWGERLGVAKGKYAGDFKSFTPELVEYAKQDVVVTRALYLSQLPKLEKMELLREVEHRFARIMVLQERNGFTLDVPAAEALASEFRQEMADIEGKLQVAFPPREIKTPFVPKVNNKKAGYQKGVPTFKTHIETFNAGSRQQIGDRLIGKGWKPRKFTPTGQPQVDESTLQYLPWPEAKLLVQYLTLQKKLGQIADGDNGWLKLVDVNAKVHGAVNSIGCAPGRCSHFNPNLAQVNKKDSRMRAVWTARECWTLVGTDGEGVQARILAHYLARYDGGAFVKKLVEGSKKLRTDVHSGNLTELSKAQCILVPLDTTDQEMWDKGRDGAKRCLYACWFGASDFKLGWTAKDGAKNAGLPVPKMTDKTLGALVRKSLNRAITGFEELCRDIKRAAKQRGYLISPLGRHVPIKSEHSALVFLMQAGEADVMKLAATIFHYEAAPDNGWVYGQDYDYVVHSHDEHQIEVRPELAEHLGKVYAACITEAGVRLNLRCPMAGAFSTGRTWADTH